MLSIGKAACFLATFILIVAAILLVLAQVVIVPAVFVGCLLAVLVSRSTHCFCWVFSLF